MKACDYCITSFYSRIIAVCMYALLYVAYAYVRCMLSAIYSLQTKLLKISAFI